MFDVIILQFSNYMSMLMPKRKNMTFKEFVTYSDGADRLFVMKW
jgi:hypothetical protein